MREETLKTRGASNSSGSEQDEITIYFETNHYTRRRTSFKLGISMRSMLTEWSATELFTNTSAKDGLDTLFLRQNHPLCHISFLQILRHFITYPVVPYIQCLKCLLRFMRMVTYRARIATFISPGWLSALQPEIELLHHLSRCRLDLVFEVSIEIHENGDIQSEKNNVHLTWLTLSASARDRAPSASISLSFRSSVWSVYWDSWEWWHTEWEEQRSSHLVDSQRFSQRSSSFSINLVVV